MVVTLCLKDIILVGLAFIVVISYSEIVVADEPVAFTVSAMIDILAFSHCTLMTERL